MPQNSSQPNRRASSARSGGSGTSSPVRRRWAGEPGRYGPPTFAAPAAREVPAAAAVGRAASRQGQWHTEWRAEPGENQLRQLRRLRRHPGHRTERGSVAATADGKERRSDGTTRVSRHPGRWLEAGSGSLECPQVIHPEDGCPPVGSRPIRATPHRSTAPDVRLTRCRQGGRPSGRTAHPRRAAAAAAQGRGVGQRRPSGRPPGQQAGRGGAHLGRVRRAGTPPRGAPPEAPGTVEAGRRRSGVGGPRRADTQGQGAGPTRRRQRHRGHRHPDTAPHAPARDRRRYPQRGRHRHGPPPRAPGRAGRVGLRRLRARTLPGCDAGDQARGRRGPGRGRRA